MDERILNLNNYIKPRNAEDMAEILISFFKEGKINHEDENFLTLYYYPKREQIDNINLCFENIDDDIFKQIFIVYLKEDEKTITFTKPFIFLNYNQNNDMFEIGIESSEIISLSKPILYYTPILLQVNEYEFKNFILLMDEFNIFVQDIGGNKMQIQNLRQKSAKK